MKSYSKTVFAAAICLVALTGLLHAQEATEQIALTPDQLVWAATPGVDGVMTAVVWGDPATGPHKAFHKFTPGFTAPLHTHSSNNEIVVISGTMAMIGEDGVEMQFPAGSFYTQSNTVRHVTRCMEGAPCLVYLEADAKWDIKPVEGQ